MPRDSFDREIDYLRISVTDRCGLGCMYCSPGRRPESGEDAMSLDEVLRVVRAALRLGVRKVRLTGGEPLMRPDIVELVGAIAREGVPDLSLTTNGMRLGELAGPLRDAGLGRLNLSLDSMDPVRFSRITGGGDLGLALGGMRAASEAGLEPVKLNMVPMRGVNDDEIPAFARLTLDSPVHVRFIEYMPAGGNAGWDSAKCVTSDEARAMVEASLGPLTRRRFRGRGPSRNFRLEGAPGIVGFISAMSHSFCYSCSRLRVTSSGMIRPCLFSNTEIDLLGPMRRGADDAELLRLLMLAIDAKPEGNYLSEPSKAARAPMHRIGG